MKWDEIVAGLPVDFVRRMRNWQRAALDMGCGMVSNYGMFGVPAGDAWDSAMPTSVGEGRDTERCLARVPLRFQQAVRVFWGYEGISMRQLAGRVSLRDHESALVRLNRGHELLQDEVARYVALCRDVGQANAAAAYAWRRAAFGA